MESHQDFNQVLDSELRDALGGLFYAMIVNRGWRHRQVETVEATGERRYQRKISFDFQISSDIIDTVTSLDLSGLPAPFMLFKKEVLLDLDVVDARGGSLPVATRAQNGLLTRAAIESEVARIAEESVSDRLSAAVEELIMSPLASAERVCQSLAAFDRIFDPGTGKPREFEVRQLLWLIKQVKDNFVFAVVLPTANLGDRQVLKISYEKDHSSQRRALKAQIGLADFIPEIRPTHPGAASSYHFEYRAPTGLDICGITPASGTDRSVDFKFAKWDYTRTIGHIVVEMPQEVMKDDSHFSTFIVKTALRPSQEGLVVTSLLSGLITSIVLTLGMTHVSRFTNTIPEPSVALLLLVPGLVATFIVRPGEHDLSSRLLRGTRFLALTPGLASFIGACLLVARVAGNSLVVTGWCVVATSWTATLLIGNMARKHPWRPGNTSNKL